MKINGNAIRPGMVIEHQDRLWRAVKIAHTQPGKGGAYLQVELKDIRSGTKLNERFRASETVERARLEQTEYQFLFADEDMCTFMHNETYEQVAMNSDLVGEEQLAYLQDGMQVMIETLRTIPSAFNSHHKQTFEVVEADAVVKGQTAASSYKPALLITACAPWCRRILKRVRKSLSLLKTAPMLNGKKLKFALIPLPLKKETNNMPPQSALITVMVNAARKASIRLKRDYGEVDQLQVSKKGPADFVTAADIRTEKLLREELLRARPGFGFLMEEAGEQLGEDTHRRWIIDPIDGTTNFVHGIAQFAISIAAEENGEITAGLIFDPISEELFWAERGQGAYLNDRRIRVSPRAKMAQSLFATGIPFMGRGTEEGP